MKTETPLTDHVVQHADSERVIVEHARRMERDRAMLLAALKNMIEWAEVASDQYPASKWGAYPPESVIQARSAIAKAKEPK